MKTTAQKLDTVFAPAGTNKPVTREEFDLLTEKVKGKEIRHEVLLMVNRLNAIGDANSARLTALESQIASLQERDAKREEKAKKRFENMPHLVALLTNGENKLSDILQRLDKLEQIDRFRVKSDWIKQVNDRLQSIEQYARTESKIREAQEAIHELENEIAAEETPQPITPDQVRDLAWLDVTQDNSSVWERIRGRIPLVDYVALTARINQHFLGEKK